MIPQTVEKYVYYQEDGIVLLHGDCLEILPLLEPNSVDLVLTDPPYPNNAGHFIKGIQKAKILLSTFKCNEWLVFWDEIERPVVNAPLVAMHIWHRTNTNRPDNYEPIYHHCLDGRKRASRVLPFAVIAKRLTGCHEATDHPTQKNLKLMAKLISMTKANVIFDPFLGSGTTAVAAKQLGRKCIGIELEQKYLDIAVERLKQGILL